MGIWLVYHEIVHLLIGILIGGLIWKWLGDRRAFIIAVLTSMFIDIDHILDYSISMQLPPGINVVFSGTVFSKGHIFILLHSWEVTALLIILGIVFKRKCWGIVCISIGAAMFGHILMDKIWYGTPWELYSLYLRILHHFLIPTYW